MASGGLNPRDTSLYSTWFCRYVVLIGLQPTNENTGETGFKKWAGEEDESLLKDRKNYWLYILFEMNNWIAKVISSKEVLIPV